MHSLLKLPIKSLFTQQCCAPKFGLHYGQRNLSVFNTKGKLTFTLSKTTEKQTVSNRNIISNSILKTPSRSFLQRSDGKILIFLVYLLFLDYYDNLYDEKSSTGTLGSSSAMKAIKRKMKSSCFRSFLIN